MSILREDIYHYCLESCESIITHFIFFNSFQSHFKDVVAAVEAYLDPILTKLHPALK